MNGSTIQNKQEKETGCSQQKNHPIVFAFIDSNKESIASSKDEAVYGKKSSKIMEYYVPLEDFNAMRKEIDDNGESMEVFLEDGVTLVAKIMKLW